MLQVLAFVKFHYMFSFLLLKIIPFVIFTLKQFHSIYCNAFGYSSLEFFNQVLFQGWKALNILRFSGMNRSENL